MAGKKEIVGMAVILGGSLLFGCASRSDVMALNERLWALERNTSQLQQRNDALRQESENLQKELDSVSRIRDERELSLRDQSAGLQATLERFREQIQRLNGKIEESQHTLGKVEQRMSALERDVSGRINRLERYLSFDRPPSASTGIPGRSAPPPGEEPPPRTGSSRPPVPIQPYPTSGGPEEGPDPPPPPISAGTGLSGMVDDAVPPDEIYGMAKQAFDQGDLETAREGFEILIDRYPRSPNADNAQFWIGEVHYRQKRYEDAILQYQSVIERYPTGNKVRAALLKQGFAFFNLGDRKNARLILQELVRKYPDSNEAKIARDKMGRL